MELRRDLAGTLRGVLEGGRLLELVLGEVGRELCHWIMLSYRVGVGVRVL